MSFLLQPWQLLLVILASWINQQQQQIIEFQRTERNRQELGNQILEAGEVVSQTTGQIECRERIGGLLRYYYRKAA